MRSSSTRGLARALDPGRAVTARTQSLTGHECRLGHSTVFLLRVVKPVASKNQRIRRYALRGLAALAIVALAAVAGVWAAAQWRLTAQYGAPLIPLKVQPSPDLIAEGERVFHI